MIITLFSGLSLSCGHNQKKNNDRHNDLQIETVSNTSTVYNIEGEDIVIRVGPGTNYDKLINKKATAALGETHYAQVDYSVKVIIKETSGDWSKIKVIEPEWLSSSHVGWILTKNIIMDKIDENEGLEKLDPNSYEIIKTEHNASVENYHVLINFSDFDKDKIYDFVKKFRHENCTRDCNVMVYDTKSILPLIDKYPLQRKEYIEFADHFVAMSTFDAPNLKSWYPFQDFRYKEYGGKNWKKEELK